jgi:hypothetical protein
LADELGPLLQKPIYVHGNLPALQRHILL